MNLLIRDDDWHPSFMEKKSLLRLYEDVNIPRKIIFLIPALNTKHLINYKGSLDFHWSTVERNDFGIIDFTDIDFPFGIHGLEHRPYEFTSSIDWKRFDEVLCMARCNKNFTNSFSTPNNSINRDNIQELLKRDLHIYVGYGLKWGEMPDKSFLWIWIYFLTVIGRVLSLEYLSVMIRNRYSDTTRVYFSMPLSYTSLKKSWIPLVNRLKTFKGTLILGTHFYDLKKNPPLLDLMKRL